MEQSVRGQRLSRCCASIGRLPRAFPGVVFAVESGGCGHYTMTVNPAAQDPGGVVRVDGEVSHVWFCLSAVPSWRSP